MKRELEIVLEQIESVTNNNEITLHFLDEHEEEIELCFYLFNKDEVEEGQLGYRIDELGNSLLGNDKGDWKEDWFVIGYDQDLGDPLFVGINDKNYPILTAEHGMGEWVPNIMYNSLKEFINDLGTTES
ncbi:hypothetical protein [Priestia megaterium]|uniref:hypothetical protein n=1 Tax=Priestia megaterium TaxID=1404 RepID=UPI002812EED2|nr:hypothetical protein [Priestia megaterium]MDR0132785.1 hypothetical protein [Priestia megaterium]